MTYSTCTLHPEILPCWKFGASACAQWNSCFNFNYLRSFQFKKWINLKLKDLATQVAKIAYFSAGE